MEILRSKNRWAIPVSIAGGIAVGICATLGVQAAGNNQPNYRRIFERTYTDPGRCLHDTPYDPAKGAFTNVNYDQTSHEDILSVLPRTANAYTPSALFFTAAHGQLIFADHYTGSLLVNAECPDLPQGY